MKNYDLIVIGSGSGLIVLEAALANGLKCAIIENSKFGGTCLTRGCIPSKILTYPADMVMDMKHAKTIGLDLDIKSIKWDVISGRMWDWIDKSKEIEASLESTKNLTVYKGTCEFIDKYTVKVLQDNGVYTDDFKAEKIVISAGARPFIPKIDGLDKAGYVNYVSFFGEKFPRKIYKSLVIIGGGAIGLEFAHIFSALGTKVTIVEFLPKLAPSEEGEISTHLEENFKKYGIDVLTDHKVVSADISGLSKIVKLQNQVTDEMVNVKCEEIFIATGLSSNADNLVVSKCNIATDPKGWIITDEYLQTSVENIWAIGDINGKFQFRHKANYEAEILARNLFSHSKTKQKVEYSTVPWAIYTYPQIAHVGMTEEQAKAIHNRVMIGKKHYSSIAKGSAMGYNNGDFDDGFVKIVADEHKKILGVHIIGNSADILLQAFVYLMNTGFSCESIDRKICESLHSFSDAFKVSGSFMPINKSMVIHPSLSELTAWVLGDLEWSDSTEQKK